jgi:hypothetical protein
MSTQSGTNQKVGPDLGGSPTLDLANLQGSSPSIVFHDPLAAEAGYQSNVRVKKPANVPSRQRSTELEHGKLGRQQSIAEVANDLAILAMKKAPLNKQPSRDC